MLTRRNLMMSTGAMALAGLAAGCSGGESEVPLPETAMNDAEPGNAAAPAPQTVAVKRRATPWDRAAFEKAMADSGRPTTMSDAEFQAIQARKPVAIQRIREYLTSRFGHADENVLAAFEELPREYYHYNYAGRVSQAGLAYETNPKPWALGFGSALSDYLGQAYMSQLAQVNAESTTLEIGTGSGFQSSLLSRIVKDAYSIEIIQPLGEAVGKLFKPLGYDNVHTRVGDGYFGWPEVTGGFDLIIATCAAIYAPPELFKQLKPGGRMIIPIGQPFKRGQVLYVYTKDENGRVHSRRDVGVFFIPMTGTILKSPHAPGAGA